MTTPFREKVRAAIDAYTATVPIGRQGIPESRLVSKLRLLLKTPDADPTEPLITCRGCGGTNRPFGSRGDVCCLNQNCPVGLTERAEIMSRYRDF